ncbi:MAG: DUF4199 domain-containing protein [bacterium]
MKTEIKYAVIFVIASFIWNCIEYVAGLQSSYINLHPFFVTPFFILLTILIYLFALREKRAVLGGKITFGKAFVTGIIISIFIIILNPVFLYIFSHYINLNFFDAFSRHEVVSGKSTKEEADEYFNFTNFLFRGSAYRLVMGIVATLFISFFMKKEI